MSLIHWFSQSACSRAPKSALAVELLSKPAPTLMPDSNLPNGRRAVRSERREQLYSVVRHAMTSVGVLSTSYKFKVLSLDSRGSSFLVMMDLVRQAARTPERMAEIEAVIVQNAKGHFEIVVSSVYWRLSHVVPADLSNRTVQSGKGLARAQPPFIKPIHDVSPIGAEEVLAFKNAFSAQGKGSPLFASGEIQQAGNRMKSPYPLPLPAERHDSDGRFSPLGPTQYGDLN